MESIKDIVAEMRKDIPRVVDAKVILRNYADRIEQAVTNCNQLKTREALEYLRDASREFCHLILNSKYNEVYDKYKHPEVAKISDAIAYANAALVEPPRNCDVGNVYKQSDRFTKFCRKHEKGCGLGWGSKGLSHPKVTCPAYKNIDCGIVWAQIPYEKEGEE